MQVGLGRDACGTRLYDPGHRPSCSRDCICTVLGLYLGHPPASDCFAPAGEHLREFAPKSLAARGGLPKASTSAQKNMHGYRTKGEAGLAHVAVQLKVLLEQERVLVVFLMLIDQFGGRLLERASRPPLHRPTSYCRFRQIIVRQGLGFVPRICFPAVPPTTCLASRRATGPSAPRGGA